MSSPRKPLHLFEAYGVEMEYMIVKNDTLEILPITDKVIYDVAGKFDSDVELEDMAWSNELVLHVIELKTNGPAKSLTIERTIEIEAKIELDIPSAFTPNGDRANDTWHLELLNKNALDEVSIKVYNKNGLVMYEANAFEKEWDGTFRGERVPVDTYYYTILVKLPYVRKIIKGIVTILY